MDRDCDCNVSDMRTSTNKLYIFDYLISKRELDGVNCILDLGDAYYIISRNAITTTIYSCWERKYYCVSINI